MATQPSLKPVGKLFAETWRLYVKHMNVLALIAVIPLIFAGAKMVIKPGFVISYGYPLWVTIVLLTATAIFALLNLVFSIVLPLALGQGVDEAHRGKVVEAAGVYKKAFAGGIQYIFILMLVVIVFLGGSVLFLIPGIIAAIYLKFSIFTYLFEDKRGMDALVTSAWYVRGSWWAILFRQILLGIVLCFAGLVFAVIAGLVLVTLHFGAPVFSMLFQLFVFMILIPYAMVYVYLLYKDAKSLKEGKEPTKSFVDESEMLFIILLIVAAVTVLVAFSMSTFGRWDVRFEGAQFDGFGGRYPNGDMMYGRHFGQYTGDYGQEGYQGQGY